MRPPTPPPIPAFSFADRPPSVGVSDGVLVAKGSVDLASVISGVVADTVGSTVESPTKMEREVTVNVQSTVIVVRAPGYTILVTCTSTHVKDEACWITILVTVTVEAKTWVTTSVAVTDRVARLAIPVT